MKAPTVKLVSHTGNSLDVLGEVKISLKLKSENEENYSFHQVYFQITNDTNRSLLGTDFITPRRAVVQYSYKDNIELACVHFPINVIVKEIQYAQELENFHFNNKTSFTLSPVWATTILPGERQVVRCKIRGIPKDLSKKLRGKTIIATLDQDLFSTKSHFVAQISSMKEVAVEIANIEATPITLNPEWVIAEGRVLDKNELQSIFHLEESIQVLSALDQIESEVFEDCFCMDSLNEDPCFLFILEPNGLTTTRNVDLRSLYERLPKVDKLFYDGRHLYIARNKPTTEADWLGIKRHLYEGQKIVFVCPPEGFGLKEIEWACSTKKACEQANLTMLLRQYTTTKCDRHTTLRWPLTNELLIRIEFNTKMMQRKPLATSLETLCTFPQDNGMCHLKLINIPDQEYPVPLCHLIFPNERSVISQPKLERTLVKIFNEPFRSNSFLTTICIQIPQLYQSTVLCQAIQNALQTISKPFKMADWKIPTFKNISVRNTGLVQEVCQEDLTELEKVDQAVKDLSFNLGIGIEPIARVSTVSGSLRKSKEDEIRIDSEPTKEQMLLSVLDQEEELLRNLPRRTSLEHLAEDSRSDVSDFSAKVEPQTEIKIFKTLDPEEQKQWRNHFQFDTIMATDEKEFYTNLLDKYHHILANTSEAFRPLKVPDRLDIKHRGVPIKQRAYPVGPALMMFAERLLDMGVKQGHLEKVKYSRYASPAFVILKPGPQAKEMYERVQQKLRQGVSEAEAFENLDFGRVCRIVIDFRKLNAEIEPIQGYFPTTVEILSFLQGKNVFSGIDLKYFFRSLRWTPEAKEMTTFILGRHMYRSDFTLEGVGLLPVYANSISQSLIKKSAEFTRVYLDDFTVATVNRIQHREAVELLFQDLEEAEALISVPKLILATDTIKVLGFMVKSDGKGLVRYEPITQMRKIFENMPLPVNTKELYRLIGCLNWCQAFLSNYQIILAPLNRLLATRVQSKTKETINWKELNTEKRSFDILMAKMARLKPLAVLTDSVPMRITTDASNVAFGSVIEVFINENWEIAQFYSKKFENSVIRSCSVINKELLAIILTLERFKQFVVSCAGVQVRTDARSLVFLYYSGNKGSDGKAARWLAKIREMNVTFIHFLPREQNQAADFLSNRFRPPSPTHDHLAKYGFSKAVKSQVKVKLEIGQKFTNDDFEKIVIEQPEGITPRNEEASDEIFDSHRTMPCDPCLKEGYDVQIEEETDTDEVQGLKVARSLNWVSRAPAVQELLNTEFKVEDVETGSIRAILPDTRFTTPFASYTADRIQQSQRKDQGCLDIINKLTDDKSLRPHLSRYTLINGVLLARIKNKHLPLDRSNLALVLPRPDITELIGTCHVMNHFGAKKLTQLVQKCFYNKETRKIARAIAIGCKSCTIHKNQTNRELATGMLRPARYPMQIVFLDVMYMSQCYHMGKSYKYILNFIDGFSSYVFSFPLTSQAAPHIMRVFETLVPHVSVAEFVSDNGNTLLVHKQVHEFLTSFNVQARLVMPYSSKSNGLCENFNKQLRKSLILTGESLNQTWVQCLPLVVRSFNLCPLQGKRFSNFCPYELVHRQLPENADPLAFLKTLEPEKYEEALEAHIENLRIFKQTRYDSMEKEMQEVIKNSQLKVGNFVYLLDILRTDKESPIVVRDRVYRIIFRKNFMLRLENVKDKKETIRCHVNKVRLINERTPEIFSELSKHIQHILGRPLTQKQLRRMHRKQTFHKDFNHQNQNLQDDSTDDQISSRSSTAIQTKQMMTPDSLHLEGQSAHEERPSPQADVPEPALTKQNEEARPDTTAKVQSWLASSASKLPARSSFLSRFSKSKDKSIISQELAGNATTNKPPSEKDSALNRLRAAFRKVTPSTSDQSTAKSKKQKPEKRPKRQQSPEPEITSTEPPPEILTPMSQVRQSKRTRPQIDYKLLATKGKRKN